MSNRRSDVAIQNQETWPEHGHSQGGIQRTYRCYCSPNIPLDEFMSYVDEFVDATRTSGYAYVILGDLNAKSPQWGSPNTDRRGHYRSRLIAEVDLVVLNPRAGPTFSIGCAEPFIDVTLATQRLGRSVEKFHFKDYHQANKPADWDIDSGYNFDANMTRRSFLNHPNNAYVTGYENGLHITFKQLASELDYLCPQNLQGFRVPLESGKYACPKHAASII
ncbi:unnamed protein product [Acanthoscelides obtectus]|uniref:Endonuclease/exonuclease/phosphatase domain-containing protein n=1 Tax=Acanthoscelides obtectus TaxID=200917 RepID=A0A9P0ME82_ACAOB|nr:unnamed protein product [Acanthoscelides obtectus]CAK1635371.1 hypothetical protein AOBTE_LOCUS9237 [Acanthoscelides obtectus]